MANLAVSNQNDHFVGRVRNVLIGSQFSLVRLLGAGSFGKVYLGEDRKGEKVAIKLEVDKGEPPSLDKEAEAYAPLANLVGFPQVHWRGEQHDFHCLVMELLGPNLEDLLQYCGGCFSLKTTLMLANQLLQRFETFHEHRSLHCDVKPENFLLGTGAQGNTVYMTDLGLVRDWKPDDGPKKGKKAKEQQQPLFGMSTSMGMSQKPSLVGTCRYASIQGHFGGARSPYDDLESLGYMLIYFCSGRLPWQGQPLQGLPDKSRKAKYQKVLQMKQETTIQKLCKGLPLAFRQYMEHVCVLRPDQVPDYEYLLDLFSQLFLSQGFVMDNVFDWTILEFQKSA